MVYTVGSGYLTSDIKAYPLASAGPTIASGSSAWGFGSWVEIVSANTITNDFSLLAVTCFIDPAAAIDTRHSAILEVGTGASGSETPVIAIPFDYFIDSAAGHCMEQVIPIFPARKIAANSRVALRIADSIAAVRTYGGCKIVYAEQLDTYSDQRIRSYPPNSAGPQPVSSATAWAWGSWVELMPANYANQDFDICAISFLFPPAGLTKDVRYQAVIELGVGSAGSEQAIIDIPITFLSDTLVDHVPEKQIFSLPIPRRVTANSRIAVRVANSDSIALTYGPIAIRYIGPAPLTITRQVGQSSDDARVTETGTEHPPWDTINLTSLYFDAGNETVGYEGQGARFTNIPIPQGATIVSAYLKLTACMNYTGVVVRTNIQGQNADNPVTFSTIEDFNARPRTTTLVAWNDIPAWSTDVEYTSPDIKTIIQEIVNRAGWASGNAMVIFWEDNLSDTGAERGAYSYDNVAAKAPKLEITYQEAGIILKEVTDSVGLVEALFRNKTLIISDSVGLAETPLKNWSPLISDVVGLADTVLRNKTFQIADSLGLTEEIFLSKFKQVLDLLGLTDSVLRNKTFTIPDTVGLSDVPLKHWTPQIVDAVSLTDTVLRNKVLEILDALGLTDAVLRDKTLMISETVSLTELIDVITGAIIQYVTDSIGLSDLVLRDKLVSLTDNVSLSELVKAAILLEAPVLILTQDGHLILRVTKPTQKKPEYILLR